MSAEPELDPAVAEIVGGLRQSRRYRTLSEPTLTRIARWSLRGGQGRQAALKAAKRKLHQVYGAYLEPGALAAAERAASRLAAGGLDVEEQRQLCLQVLARHSSTAERLPFLDRFYAALTPGPPPSSILDLACGLNPFAFPWMQLRPGARYVAVDVDDRLAAVVNRLSAASSLSLTGLAHDLVDGPPPGQEAEVVLLLKTIPCLEQQEAGAGRRLLHALDAPCVVASFPARSLGGREKGMRQTYDRLLREMVAGTGRAIETFEYPTETVYRLTR